MHTPDQRTIVFADIEGYSDHVLRTGDERAGAVLAHLDAIVRATCARHADVRRVKRLGDGVLCVALTAEAGVVAATELVAGFATTPTGLRLRAGVHRGVVRHDDGEWHGYHVNVAYRVMESARGGQVLTSPHALAGLDLGALGLSAHRVGTLSGKGIAAPIGLHAVDGDPLAAPIAG